MLISWENDCSYFLIGTLTIRDVYITTPVKVTNDTKSHKGIGSK